MHQSLQHSASLTLFFESQGLPKGSAFDAGLLDTKDTLKSRSDTERKVGLTAWETSFSTKALCEMDPLNIEEYDKRIFENHHNRIIENNFRALLEEQSDIHYLRKGRGGGGWDETKQIKCVESKMQSS